MKTKHKVLVLVWAVLWSSALGGQTSGYSCSRCAEWNALQTPFRIFGNTYYVGPSGVGSILITSTKGHVLLDGALPESAGQIASNIRKLGFRVEDVKLILNSHAHFDHAGGIAELQRLSGAHVAASDWSAAVLTDGVLGKDDPQYGTIPASARVSNIERLHDGQTLHVGDISVTAHLTPGHTPGGTSWTWVSCEQDRCLKMVYADSLTPVSADGYQFTNHAATIAGFHKSYEFLRQVGCDIVLTPHPDVSSQWRDIKAWRLEGKHQPAIDGSACRQLADQASEQLRQRLASEKSAK